MKRTIFILAALALFAAQASADNYLLNGGQESVIRYQMVQQVVPHPALKKLILSFVIPQSFSSPTYSQKITDFNLNFSVPPSTREEKRDEHGNAVVRVTWTSPPSAVETRLSLNALNRVSLKPLQTSAPFPLKGLSPSIRSYLQATDQVPSTNPQIRARARALTAGAKTEFDAVQKILSWVIDHMRYVLTPKEYGALYSFETGRGNCQNYSHLAAALMRAQGIPARIVNGITLKQPYDVKMGRRTLTLKMAQGRHSWIEVYFPDLGWAPFDPQQTELFVSNRFIRVEVGLDNDDTTNDGMVRWTQSRGSRGKPRFEEVIEADFARDRVNLTAVQQNYGPKKMLLSPSVTAKFTPYVASAKPTARRLKPKSAEPKKPTRVAPSRPPRKPELLTFGNTDFPENLDFLLTRGPAESVGEGQFEMRKNFLVETAEYVTSSAQYAQIFKIEKSLRMRSIGLALHRFGGSGYLWVEVLKDAGGKPGEPVVTSSMLDVEQMSLRPGYRWADLIFPERITLPPGDYWIALGFTGSPIVNWFYSYGKPVGPPDGTRYRTIMDEQWSKSLSFEFVYRVQGWAAN